MERTEKKTATPLYKLENVFHTLEFLSLRFNMKSLCTNHFWGMRGMLLKSLNTPTRIACHSFRKLKCSLSRNGRIRISFKINENRCAGGR